MGRARTTGKPWIKQHVVKRNGGLGDDGSGIAYVCVVSCRHEGDDDGGGDFGAAPLPVFLTNAESLFHPSSGSPSLASIGGYTFAPLT